MFPQGSQIIAERSGLFVQNDRLQRRLVACMALSALLHALVLLAYRERGPTRPGFSEAARAPAIEATFRAVLPARDSPQRDIAPRENSRDAPSQLRGTTAGDESPGTGDPAAQAQTRRGVSDDRHIDFEVVRKIAREAARSGKAPPLPSSGPQPDTALGRAIAQAARPDCRVARGEMGLLAIPFLLLDTLRDKGCKW
jgi:hypothetical protein